MVWPRREYKLHDESTLSRSLTVQGLSCGPDQSALVGNAIRRIYARGPPLICRIVSVAPGQRGSPRAANSTTQDTSFAIRKPQVSPAAAITTFAMVRASGRCSQSDSFARSTFRIPRFCGTHRRILSLFAPLLTRRRVHPTWGGEIPAPVSSRKPRSNRRAI